MKVKELIEILQDYDPEANVLIMQQPSWPFENEIAGVKAREDFEEPDEDEVQSEGKEPNDVFILEGTQLRYGSKDAW